MKKLFCLLMLVGLIFHVVAKPQLSHAMIAIEPNFWNNGLEISQTDSLRLLNGFPCSNEPFARQDSLTWKNECGFYTGYGFTNGKLLAKNLVTTNSVSLNPRSNYTPLYFPGSKVVLYKHYNTSGEQLLFVTKDIFEAKDFLSSNLPNFETNESGFHLQYKDRSFVDVNGAGVSRNGQYLAVAVRDSGVFKLDLESGSVVSISNLNSDTDWQNLSITNDGRYVSFVKKSTYSWEDGRAFVIDSKNCANTYHKDNLPARGSMFENPGCDLSNFGVMNINQKLAEATNSEEDEIEINSVYLDSDSAYSIVDAYHGNSTDPQEGKIYYDSPGQHTFKLDSIFYKQDSTRPSGYLALGDSFTSGEGDNLSEWYEPGTDLQGNEDTFSGRNLCHLSRRSYPYQISLALGFASKIKPSPSDSLLFHSVACSGAKIHNIIGGTVGEDQSAGNGNDFSIRDNQYRYNSLNLSFEWQPGGSLQLRSLDNKIFATDKTRYFKPEIITVGIGGNDANFGNFLAECAKPGNCDFANAGSNKNKNLGRTIVTQKTRLKETFQALKSEAPRARIYAVGYPQFIKSGPSTCNIGIGFSELERNFAADAINFYNGIIEAAAREAGVNFVNVEDALNGGKLCEQYKFVNGISGGNDRAGIHIGSLQVFFDLIGSESFHPNEKGQTLLAQEMLATTNQLSQQNPEQSDFSPIPLPTQSSFGQYMINYVNEYNTSTMPDSYKSTQLKKLLSFIQSAGTKLLARAKANGLKPGSIAKAVVESDPTEIGEATVDENGEAVFEFDLENLVGPGYHEIHIYGTDKNDQMIDYYEGFFVGASDDFDQDGVTDQKDSCRTIPNSGADEDNDGTDDACDGLYLAKSASAPGDGASPSDSTPIVAATTSPVKTESTSSTRNNLLATSIRQNSFATNKTLSALDSSASGNSGENLAQYSENQNRTQEKTYSKLWPLSLCLLLLAILLTIRLYVKKAKSL